MFPYESAHDRAHDHLASVAREACTTEDVEAALRVLDAMTDRAALQPLYARATWDYLGNAVVDTPEQELHHNTWAAASDLIDRLEHLRDALAQAMRRPVSEETLKVLREALDLEIEITHPKPYRPAIDPNYLDDDPYRDGGPGEGPAIER